MKTIKKVERGKKVIDIPEPAFLDILASKTLIVIDNFIYEESGKKTKNFINFNKKPIYLSVAGSLIELEEQFFEEQKSRLKDLETEIIARHQNSEKEHLEKIKNGLESDKLLLKIAEELIGPLCGYNPLDSIKFPENESQSKHNINFTYTPLNFPNMLVLNGQFWLLNETKNPSKKITVCVKNKEYFPEYHGDLKIVKDEFKNTIKEELESNLECKIKNIESYEKVSSQINNLRNEFYDSNKDFGYKKAEDGYYYIYKKKPAYALKGDDGYFYNFNACEFGVPVVLERGRLKIKSKVYGSDSQWGLVISPKNYTHPFVGSAHSSEETDFCLDGSGSYYRKLKNKNLSLVDQISTVLSDLDLTSSEGYTNGVNPRQRIENFKNQRAGKWR